MLQNFLKTLIIQKIQMYQLIQKNLMLQNFLKTLIIQKIQMYLK
jgi:hypothetical protein